MTLQKMQIIFLTELRIEN